MKRTVSFLLVSLLLVTLLLASQAQETTEGFQYRIETNGNVTITGYIGKNSDMSIPSEIDGKPVTEIGNGAFMQNETIKHVTIPEGIVKIGDGAFSQCSNIESLELPSSVNIICNKAFSQSNLQQIILSDGLLKIDADAFAGSLSLTSLVLPNSVKEIGPYAFMYSYKLVSAILPSGLKRIGYGIFAYDNALEKVAIPKSVSKIDPNIVWDCFKVSIWGFKGSIAENYAKKKNIPFVIVEPVKDVVLLLSGENVTKGKLSIDLGSDITSLQLSAQTSPENPWPGVTWKSSDAKVAPVDFSGLVTGLKKGKVTITATAVDGSGKKATCDVTIANLVKEVIITGEDTVQAGKKITLQATVLPDTADSKKLDWTTSDKTIATVDAKGAVTAKKVTEAQIVTITATAKDGSGVFAEFVITVVP